MAVTREPLIDSQSQVDEKKSVDISMRKVNVLAYNIYEKFAAPNKVTKIS